MGLKRGDVVTVAMQGDFGKPRPAVVVESDLMPPTDHVLVCLGTSHLVAGTEPRRVLALPSADNGLKLPTQFQSDKVMPTRRDRCGEVIGRLDRETMVELTGQLGVLLGFGE